MLRTLAQVRLVAGGVRMLRTVGPAWRASTGADMQSGSMSKQDQKSQDRVTAKDKAETAYTGEAPRSSQQYAAEGVRGDMSAESAGQKMKQQKQQGKEGSAGKDGGQFSPGNVFRTGNADTAARTQTQMKGEQFTGQQIFQSGSGSGSQSGMGTSAGASTTSQWTDSSGRGDAPQIQSDMQRQGSSGASQSGNMRDDGAWQRVDTKGPDTQQPMSGRQPSGKGHMDTKP